MVNIHRPKTNPYLEWDGLNNMIEVFRPDLNEEERLAIRHEFAEQLSLLAHYVNTDSNLSANLGQYCISNFEELE